MFNKLRVRTRLIVLLSIMVVTVVLMGMLGVFNAEKSQEQINNVYHGGVDSIEYLSSVWNELENGVADTLMKLSSGLMPWSEATDVIRKAKTNFAESWKKYLSTSINFSAEFENQRQSFVDKIQKVVNETDVSLKKLEDIIQQKNPEQLSNYIKKDLFAFMDPLTVNIDQLHALHVKETHQDYETALSSAKTFETVTIITLVLALLITIPLALLISQSIIKPLEYAVEKVNRIAAGDTAIDVEIISKGELGILLESLKKMIFSTDKMSSTLATIATGDLTVEATPRSEKDILGYALQDMISQMQTMIGSIRDDVNALTTSSQEIITSLSQLSTATSETAAAVTETTTTVEELKQTAHISTDKAKDVLSSAEQTLQTVKSSETSVTATIEDMNQIRERMQIISDSILKLSEKSLAIAEIMDTVNDLAEQSNLLAVNAAIEAAKAGEQGRSFGVVAQEIRTLAEQSKGATVQVRSLLSEIQNATNAAVLATEQGSKAVTKGVEQSKQTSEAIRELAENMTTVAQATNQIVLSSQQQLVGIEQVTVAMTNINEATNQHVDHLRQIESAVSTLNQVGGTLKDLTDQYRLNTENTVKAKKIPNAKKIDSHFSHRDINDNYAFSKEERRLLQSKGK